MWQFSLTRVKPFPKEPNKSRFQKLSHWGQQCTLAQLAAAVHSLWCSPSWTTASSLLWSPRMFAWCSTRATPRSRPHAPCAASSAAATPSPPTRECSWCLCHCWCFLLEDLGSFSSFFFSLKLYLLTGSPAWFWMSFLAFISVELWWLLSLLASFPGWQSWEEGSIFQACT